MNSDDEFRHAIGPVQKIKNDRVTHPKPRIRVVINKPIEEREHLKLDIEPPTKIKFGASLHFARSGIQVKQLKLLRQGKLCYQASADLHGLTAKEARLMLEEFIHHAVEQQLRVIHIVHGQGYGSRQQEPVLKNLVNQILQEFSPVLAFCSAQPKDGGLGAIYVLLKAS